MQPLKVLLVEDDDRDALLTTRAFSKQSIRNVEFHRVSSGEEALAWLDTTLYPPHLVILDLHLNGMSGYSFLSILKNSSLSRIPVIILSSSKDDLDIDKGWQMHASGYLQKPIDVKDFRELADQFVGWWNKNELGSR